MSTTVYLSVALVVLLLLLAFLIWRRRRPRKLDTEHFAKHWRQLQKHCATRKTWPLAVVAADNLVDEALKELRFKGKTAGERLVAAQHVLSSNERVWFGHKLRDKVTKEDVRKLKKQDVLQALSGFRQALKDLGALK